MWVEERLEISQKEQTKGWRDGESLASMFSSGSGFCLMDTLPLTRLWRRRQAHLSDYFQISGRTNLMGTVSPFDGRHGPRATDHLIIDAFRQLSHVLCVRETHFSVSRLDKRGDSFCSVPIMKRRHE